MHLEIMVANAIPFILVGGIAFVIGRGLWRHTKRKHADERVGVLLTKIEGKTKRSAERAEAKLHNWLDK